MPERLVKSAQGLGRRTGLDRLAFICGRVQRSGLTAALSGGRARTPPGAFAEGLLRAGGVDRNLSQGSLPVLKVLTARRWGDGEAPLTPSSLL